MSRYSKALVAAIPFLIAALKVLADALGDGRVTSQELVAVALAGLGAIGVYLVPNRPPAGQSADPDMSEQGNTRSLPAHFDRPTGA